MGKLHHWQVAGHLQGQFIAFPAIGLGGCTGCLAHIIWQTVDFGERRKIGEGVSGIQRVLAELLAQGRLPLLDVSKALARRPLKFGAAEHKISNRIAMRLALLCIKAGRVDRFVLGIKALVGTQSGKKFGDPGQHFVVSGAQGWGIGHRIQVADRAPGAAQAFGGNIQNAGYRSPAGWKFWRGHGFQGAAGQAEQLVYGGSDMRGADLVKQWQLGV